jgi:pimeloyl-ACP methyl ester carboxylesterase
MKDHATDDLFENRIAAGETPLACRIRGCGRTLVAVHGALSDLRVWEPLAARLSRYRRVITYTQRYFGTGPWPDDGAGFSRDRHVADLIRLAESLGGDPVDLLAWSYGGDVAVRAILARPDLFRRAVLFDPSVGAVLRHMPEAGQAKTEFRQALQPATALLDAGREPEAALAFFSGVAGLTLKEIDAFGPDVSGIVRDNARTLKPFLSTLLPGGGNDVHPADFAELTCVPLILTGDRSLARYQLIAGWLAEVWPGAQRRTITGAGHFGPWERAAEIAECMEKFLSLPAAFDPSLQLCD